MFFLYKTTPWFARWLGIILWVSVSLLTACHQTPKTHEEQERQAAFKALLVASEAVNLTLKEDAPIATDVLMQQVKQLQTVVANPFVWFRDPTITPSSRSLDLIWIEHAQFQEHIDALLRATQALSSALNDAPTDTQNTSPAVTRIVSAQEREQLQKAMQAVNASCVACHRHFRR